MTAPADLVEKRAALLAARASEARSTRFGEDEVTFRSDAELAAAIGALDREIAKLQGTRVNTFLPYFPEGY